jgi:hypothetical protein
MEGCLTALIKMMILGFLFLVGLVLGYLYYQGTFDPPLVRYHFGQIEGVTSDRAASAVDAAATPELASRDFSKVDGKYVQWVGQVAEFKPLAPDLAFLSILTSEEPRRVAVVFTNKSLEPLSLRIGDRLEVLGLARRLLVPSEDREGQRFPQVLAVRLRKVADRPELDAPGGRGGASGAVDVAPAPPPAAVPRPERGP